MTHQSQKSLNQRLFVFCSQNFDGNITKRIKTDIHDKRTLKDFLIEIEYSKQVFKEKFFGIGKKRIDLFSKVLFDNGILLK